MFILIYPNHEIIDNKGQMTVCGIVLFYLSLTLASSVDKE